MTALPLVALAAAFFGPPSGSRPSSGVREDRMALVVIAEALSAPLLLYLGFARRPPDPAPTPRRRRVARAPSR